MPIIFVPVPLPPSPMPYPPGTVLANPNGTVGAVPLNQVDNYGVEWLWQDIEGWDSPEAATQVTQRSGQDGAWSGVELYGPRQLSLSGAAWTDQPEIMRDAADRLFAEVTKKPFQLVVDEHGLQRFVTVQRQSAVVWDYQHETAALWSMQLVAIDPRKYGTTEQTATVLLGAVTGGFVLPFTLPFTIDSVVTSDTITAINAGNHDAPLMIRVFGPVINPKFFVPSLNLEMSLNLTLDVGEFVDIDSDKRSVLLGGTATRLSTFEGDWLSVPPGSTDIRFLAESYDPSAFAQLTWRATWL